VEPKGKPNNASLPSDAKSVGPLVRDVIATAAGLATLATLAEAKLGTSSENPFVESALAGQIVIERNKPLHIKKTKKTVFVCSPFWDPNNLDAPIEYWGTLTIILPAAQATIENDTKSVCREISKDDISSIVDEMKNKIDGIAKFYEICDPENCLDKTFTVNVRKTTKTGFETEQYEDTIRIGRTRLRAFLRSILRTY
jgi:hypothetical protein